MHINTYMLSNHNKSKHKLKRTKCYTNEDGQAFSKAKGCASLEQRMLCVKSGI